jgi:hypothetical protein
MDETDDRDTPPSTPDPESATCPACHREYRCAVALADDGVIRGLISGDVCLTSEHLFVHSTLTVDEPDDEFPTKEVGAMGNRREVPVEPRAVSGVCGDGDDWYVMPD